MRCNSVFLKYIQPVNKFLAQGTSIDCKKKLSMKLSLAWHWLITNMNYWGNPSIKCNTKNGQWMIYHFEIASLVCGLKSYFMCEWMHPLINAAPRFWMMNKWRKKCLVVWCFEIPKMLDCDPKKHISSNIRRIFILRGKLGNGHWKWICR